MDRSKPLQEQVHEYVFGYSKLKGFSARTIRNKNNFFNRLLRFLDGRDLTIDTAREFILHHSAAGNSGNTIATETRNIRAFSNWQATMNYAESFADKLEQPKQVQPEFEILPDNILKEIIDFGTEPRPFKPHKSGDHAGHRAAKAEARAALHFMRLHGTRVGETLDIHAKDLRLNDDPPAVWIRRKGGKRELLPLHLDIIQDLRERAERGDRIFRTNRERTNMSIQRGARMMGYNEHLVNHSLRHSFATNKIREGQNLPQVSRILGHSGIGITDKMYTHLNIADVAKVVNSNAVYGVPIQEKLDDLQRYVKDKFKKDPRFRVEEMGQSDYGDSIELTIRVVAKKT